MVMDSQDYEIKSILLLFLVNVRTRFLRYEEFCHWQQFIRH